MQAWVVGPGGGDDAAARLRMALDDGVPVVVDADALTHLPERLAVPALLTPHAGELARMLDVSRDDVEADPLGHATAAAERWEATVLLKGVRTLVVHPGARHGSTSPARRGSAPPAPATSWPGSPARCSPPAPTPTTPARSPRSCTARRACAATGGGPVTAGRVADAVPAVIGAFHDGTLDDRLRDWRDR